MGAHYLVYPDKNDFLLFRKRQFKYRMDGFKKGTYSKKKESADNSHLLCFFMNNLIEKK